MNKQLTNTELYTTIPRAVDIPEEKRLYDSIHENQIREFSEILKEKYPNGEIYRVNYNNYSQLIIVDTCVFSFDTPNNRFTHVCPLDYTNQNTYNSFEELCSNYKIQKLY